MELLQRVGRRRTPRQHLDELSLHGGVEAGASEQLRQLCLLLLALQQLLPEVVVSASAARRGLEELL